jgi:hypothetical protein
MHLMVTTMRAKPQGRGAGEQGFCGGSGKFMQLCETRTSFAMTIESFFEGVYSVPNRWVT